MSGDPLPGKSPDRSIPSDISVILKTFYRHSEISPDISGGILRSGAFPRERTTGHFFVSLLVFIIVSLFFFLTYD